MVVKNALLQEGQACGSRYRLPFEQDSLHNAVDFLHNAIDSVHNDTSLINNNESTDDMITLQRIAMPARDNKRLAPKKMEQVILELCRDRWLSRKQLAELLLRNSDGLLSRFLTPMVEHGLLHLRYPDKPNRVDQAYTSTVGAK